MSDEDSSLMIRVMVKTAEYLEYIKDHYNKVQQAWKDVQAACEDNSFVWDDFRWMMLEQEIQNHDLSKLSAEEFVPYRDKFFSAAVDNYDDEMVEFAFDKAWEHHKENNDHHWENWTKTLPCNPYYHEMCCMHMIIDWIAMADARGNPIDKFYNENKDKIKIPAWAHELVQDVLKCVTDYRK